MTNKLKAHQNTRRVVLILAAFGWVVVLAAIGTLHGVADDASPVSARATPVVQAPKLHPKPPHEAVQTIEVLAGFRVDLIAHEPLVADPVAMVYDENGRAYVAEMSSFQFPHENDDIQAGRVRLLEDRDGDGTFDVSHDFADGISIPSGLACWKGGVFVTAAPDIWYLKDSDGDGRADVRRKVYTGFGMGNIESTVNNLQWGIDHKIYGSSSRNGGKVRALEPADAAEISLRLRDFRFDPVSGKLETLAQAGGQWGNSFDDWYNRFGCDNTGPARHIVLPTRYLDRNPQLIPPQLYQSLAREQGTEPVYRVSPPEPWRTVRAARRQALGKNANPGEINAVGYFTASSGITVYRGDAFPASFRGNLFVGEPAGNLVHRRVVQPHGVTFLSHRVDKEKEIVAARDNFFRPVNFVNAPDGTLHIVDMYREVVEDPSWVPEDLKAAKTVDMTGGAEYGRIYRLAPSDFTVPPPPQLGKADTATLVQHLENRNAWWRETAHRLLYERRDRSVIPQLQRLLVDSHEPLARLYALWLLEGFDALRAENIARALADEVHGVRRHAVLLSESRLGTHRELLEKVVALADDPSPSVRMQVAFTLGEIDDTGVVAALARIIEQDVGDHWIRTAVLSSASTSANHLAETLLDRREFVQRIGGIEFVKQLATMIGARNRKDEIDRFLTVITNSSALSEEPTRLTSLIVALGEGLRKSGNDMLQRLAEDDAEPAGRLVYGLLQRARQTAADSDVEHQQRTNAIELIGYEPFDRAATILGPLLDSRQPQDVQLAAARTLARYAHPDVVSIFVEALNRTTPALRSEMVESLLGRTEWIAPFLDALGEGKASAAQISASRRNQLLKHDDPEIRQRAVALFGTDAPGPRSEAIARYRQALAIPGDSKRGQIVYERDCTVCHRFGSKGHDVGPNLSAYGRQSVTPEGLLTQILDPSREVRPDYIDYIVALDDGRTVTGMIQAETPTHITFKREKNQQVIVARNRIEEIKSTGKSLMPEGLEKALSIQDMADLLEFLTTIHQKI